MAGTLRPPLVDRFDRRIESMRLSVTDRCDLRCFYCIPDEDIEWLPRRELLSLEEIGRVARIAVESGVRKLRLTGGEPLLRKDLPVYVYCYDQTCHLAAEASLELVEQGFRAIEVEGGWERWVQKGFRVETVAAAA